MNENNRYREEEQIRKTERIKKVKKLQQENETIYNRYQKYYKGTERIDDIYQSRADYQRNIEHQKDEMYKMDVSSPEFKELKSEIEEQEKNAMRMRYENINLNEDSILKKTINDKKKENQEKIYQMSDAIEKGDIARYERISKEYENNIKTQEGIHSSLKKNNIECEDTTITQKIYKKDLDLDMRNKLFEDMSKQKKVRHEQQEAYEKYFQKVKEDEKQLLEQFDRNKVSSGFGIPDEEIKRQREELEKSRNIYLGEEKNR